MAKVACVFNIAAHYREPIYKLIDDNFDCDFYIGNSMKSNIEKMNYKSLKGFKKLLLNKFWGKFYWQSGISAVFKNKYDHVILTGEFYCISTWFILLICFFSNTQTYLWTHGWYGREGIFKRIVKKIFFGLSSKVLLYGEYAQRLMIEAGFDNSKLEVIYNSLDLENQSRISLVSTNIYSNYFDNNYPVLIYVGRVQKVKRLDMLIESLYMLNKRKSYFNLVIVGQADATNEIEDLVISKGLENKVWFYGPCFDEERLAELIYNAALCVSPGNIGLTGIHSLTYGTPVLTHDNFKNQMPEFEVVEEGVTGAFFKEGDVDSLTNKISVLYSYNLKRSSVFPVILNKYNSTIQIDILKSLFIK